MPSYVIFIPVVLFKYKKIKELRQIFLQNPLIKPLVYFLLTHTMKGMSGLSSQEQMTSLE